MKDNIRKILFTALTAMLFLAGGKAVSAEEDQLLRCKLLSSESTTYSNYANAYDKEKLEFNIRLYNATDKRLEGMHLTIKAPEGYSLAENKQKSAARFTVKPFTDKLNVNVVLYPVGDISESAEDKMTLTAELGDVSVKYSIPVKTEYSSDTFTVQSSEAPGGKLEFLFSPYMFTKGMKEYDGELSKASLAMAMSAFSSDSSEENWNEEMPRDKNIRAFYKKLGFEGYVSEKYSQKLSDLTDTVAYALSSQKMTAGGREFTLVAAAVRGGGYGAEWASNMNVGTGTEHKGFSDAAAGVISGIEGYIESIGADPESTVIWISGYSRGAAVANITAAKLLDSYTVYGYTFATPATVKKSAQKDADIYNVISANDLIPTLPLSGGHWNYVRYGHDIVYGKRSNGLKKVDKMLKAACPSVDTYVKYFQDELMAYAASSNHDGDAIADDTSVASVATMIFACYANAKTEGVQLGNVTPNFNFFTGEITISVDDMTIVPDEITSSTAAHYPAGYVAAVYGLDEAAELNSAA